jgi:hypothetical protein
MMNTVRSLVAIAIAALVSTQAHAALVYNFNSQSTSGANARVINHPDTAATTIPNTTASQASFVGYGNGSVYANVSGNILVNFAAGAGDLGSASINTAKYVDFTVTANSGYNISLQTGGATLTFDLSSSSGTAPISWAVRSSVDTFGANISSGSTTSTSLQTQTVSFSGSQYDNLSSIEFRVYLWNGGGGGAPTANFDNLTLLNPTVVPEPVNMALATFAGLAGLGLCVGAVRRKFGAKAQPQE